MLNEQKQQNAVLKKQVQTRRKFLQWSVIGGLIALPVGLVIYRKNFTTRRNMVEIKVPICEGVFTPKELKIPNIVGDIELISLDIFSARGDTNSFILTFVTHGAELKSTKNRIQLELYGKNNEVLDYVADSFMDTRLAARLSGRASPLNANIRQPADAATIFLDTPIQLFEIDKIVISAFQI
ncbi:MAG: hypothetical protein LBC20_00300 [Planctomycetaceae bacterium]|jgi:hypothetical protein|nr:hypothetical protein [Planctomycetaceae bacterium]